MNNCYKERNDNSLELNIIPFKKFNVSQSDRKKEIGLHLKLGHSKNNSKVKIGRVEEAILYQLKTGCQWREFPTRQFFDVDYSWKTVYYHFQKWSKNVSWQ